MFVTWKSIPAFFRDMPKEKAIKHFGDDEELVTTLFPIKTQSQFAEKFGIEQSTLTNWNKLIAKRNLLDDTRKWGQKLTKNVLFSLYRLCLEKPDAKAIELWFQLMHGWNSRKSLHSPEYEGVGSITYTVFDHRCPCLEKE